MGAAIPLFAQTAAPAGNSGAAIAWQNLQTLLQSRVPGNGNGIPVTTLVNAANQFANFYANYPGDKNAKDAKCLEGIMLLHAAMAGDTADEARRNAVVTATRNDKSITPALRAELFATADTLAVVRQPRLSRDQLMAAYERNTRSLIAEFPSLPNGYESLVCIARDSADAKGAALSAELVSMAVAPQSVKDEAKRVAARFALVGQSLSSLVGPQSSLGSATGHPVVIYAWSRADNGSILRAKTLVGRMPGGALFVGVCLDTDIAAAQSAALSGTLPGEQIYDPLGTNGAVAQKLDLDLPTFIYGADATGIIRSVALATDLGASFAVTVN